MIRGIARWQAMSDYISKSAIFEVMSDVFNSYGNNALNFDEEETKAIKRFCAMLQSQIAELPTLDETEIIRKPFERVVKRFEELKNDCDCYGHLKKKGLVDWTIEIVKEECGIND